MDRIGLNGVFIGISRVQLGSIVFPRRRTAETVAGGRFYQEQQTGQKKSASLRRLGRAQGQSFVIIAPRAARSIFISFSCVFSV